MNFQSIANAVARLTPEQLFLLALAEFFAIILLILLVTYCMFCIYNENHRLGGNVNVDVVLQDTLDDQMIPLHYGSFPIRIQDRDDQEPYPFFPPRNLLQKGLPRTYPVLTFLGRFTAAFENSIGLKTDESTILLRQLLEDSTTKETLGSVYLGKGSALGYFGVMKHHWEGDTKRTLCITCPLNRALPESVYVNTPADRFSKATGCDVHSFQITLEWNS